MPLHDDLVGVYERFSRYAGTDSPTYADWSRRVAHDPQVLTWLQELPDAKRQPNLVFAAARLHGGGTSGRYSDLRDALLDRATGDVVRRTILARSTQTNEVGRLATLLPALAQVEGPLALVEAGASAGPCLYPDRWDYRWETPSGSVVLGERDADDPGVLVCAVAGEAPLPDRRPDVTWRGGVDLHPLDVTSPDDVTWLTTLVWPEDDDRRSRLRRAVEVARTDPPTLVRGDLLDELPALVDRASAHGTVVVLHSAVAAYLEPVDRLRFETMMHGLVADGRCRWISNEDGEVLPSVTATGPRVDDDRLGFVLGLDGRAMAHTHGHGRAMRWLGESS